MSEPILTVGFAPPAAPADGAGGADAFATEQSDVEPELLVDGDAEAAVDPELLGDAEAVEALGGGALLAGAGVLADEQAARSTASVARMASMRLFRIVSSSVGLRAGTAGTVEPGW